MKKRLTLLLLLAAAPLWALAGATIEVGAAALYWQPCVPAYPYALVGNVVGQQVINPKLFSVEPSFHWGVRVGAQYTNTSCNLFVGFRGTRLWSIDRGRLQGAPFNAVIIPDQPQLSTSIRSTLDVDYWTIDVRGGHTWACLPCLSADFYLLGRYAFLRRRANGKASGFAGGGETQNIQEMNVNGRFKGGGFGLGFGTRYELFCGFRLRSDLTIGGLYGEQLYAAFTHLLQLSDEVNNESFRIRNAHFSCLPFFDVRGALEYSRCLCGFLEVAAQLGWEYNAYPGALPIPGDTSLVNGLGQHLIGFGGPFVNVVLRF